MDLRERPAGDSYYLRTLLLNEKVETKQRLGNIQVVSGDFARLDKIDLRPYSTIYLMNVPTLSDAAVKNLEKFVREGGGVGVFLARTSSPMSTTRECTRTTAAFSRCRCNPSSARN